ncbi:MAG: hypothetical protein V7785_21540 [Bermanella sp.]
MKAFSIILTLFLSYSCYGELYRCSNDSGITYSDSPCSNNAQAYQPPQEMGLTLKTINAPSSYNKNVIPKKTNKSISSACNQFSPTQLRNLRVKRQLKKGIPATNIEKRFGKPVIVKSSKANSEVWHYKSERVQRTFKFQHECLVSWSEKFKGKKSQLSKYQQ